MKINYKIVRRKGGGANEMLCCVFAVCTLHVKWSKNRDMWARGRSSALLRMNKVETMAVGQGGRERHFEKEKKM